MRTTQAMPAASHTGCVVRPWCPGRRPHATQQERGSIETPGLCCDAAGAAFVVKSCAACIVASLMGTRARRCGHDSVAVPRLATGSLLSALLGRWTSSTAVPYFHSARDWLLEHWMVRVTLTELSASLSSRHDELRRIAAHLARHSEWRRWCKIPHSCGVSSFLELRGA